LRQINAGAANAMGKAAVTGLLRNPSGGASKIALGLLHSGSSVMRANALVTVVVGCLAMAGIVRGETFELAPIKPTISVTGNAEVRVPPNEVYLRLGVESRDPKLDAAATQNEERLAAVLKFLKTSGIDAKDVQTDYVEIHPQYELDRRAQQLAPEFYLVRRNLGIRLRKPAQFDAVLTGALKQGVNYVLGIEFRTTELRKHRDAAREQATRAAKEKAVALAKELGVKVGRPQTIAEQVAGNSWSWSGSVWQNVNAMTQNSVQNVAGGGDIAEGNLAVGQISITATVSVTFRLEE
jgi:uncharacterized protein YggE